MMEIEVTIAEAIALSGQSRLRPMPMTSLTAILGMIPMALRY